MSSVPAYFYSNKSSQPHQVKIYFEEPDTIHVHGEQLDGEKIDFRCKLHDVELSSRVGNTPRHLRFAHGSQCEVEDNDTIDEWFRNQSGTKPSRMLHIMESGLPYVFLAAAFTALALWAGIMHGIPALAKEIAFRLPDDVNQMISSSALEQLDAELLQPTKLSSDRQEELRAVFTSMTADMKDALHYRLEFRSSKDIGANALALPSGTVVVTDALVDIAKNDDELIAVLAHELGHLRQRHGLRHVLQASATVLAIIVVTGDLTSVMSVSASLSTFLVQAKYSRDFELEADDFAFQHLKKHDISPTALGDILTRMEEEDKEEDGTTIPDYLSTHPSTQERMQRAKEMVGNPPIEKNE